MDSSDKCAPPPFGEPGKKAKSSVCAGTASGGSPAAWTFVFLGSAAVISTLILLLGDETEKL
jgi:hypothetical protein